ncbi:phospholipid-transporting atpase [Blastocystis sp. ATCC 50177/Nand II]|uniref:Phospholipid-transporting atpase n=1 Tax=Blastocystis sp. subtype 1 (strain ATCC 50177 / NandII) TaxID=478820 RepID=A0A196SJV8_BLAHN|nr:phospholipid-transporting atpase [Blastocystis sp. ATCC 50177/Nand II]
MVEKKKVRSILVNRECKEFGDNTIHNTKYHWWSFLFVTIFQQIEQPLNAYFILESFLELFPVISSYNPLATWIPILVIFAITCVREAAEDINRYKRDKQANNRLVRVLRGDLLVEVKSKDLHVGDIVYVEDGDEIPCDMVVLYTSESNGNCYIQTMNIDGETCLKLRRAPAPLQTALHGDSLEAIQHHLNTTRIAVDYESPNAHVYQFNGRLTLNNTTEVSLSSSNLLLQVTRLQNTRYLFGAVVYTGNETKFGQNKIKPKLKLAPSDRISSVFVVAILCFHLLLVVILSPIGVYLNEDVPYWYLERNLPYIRMIIPLRFLLLNAGMVPSTLKVLLELIKVAYVAFIHHDEHFNRKDTPEDERVHCNSMSLCETLGNVRFLLTDKTGTLTRNELVLREMAVGEETLSIPPHAGETYDYQEPHVQWSDRTPKMLEVELERCVLLCNSCVLDRGVLFSDNPDEVALLRGARESGSVLLQKHDEKVEIRVGGGQPEAWRLLRVIAFSSDRKRMSVVAKNEKTGVIRVYAKGADDCIFSLCAEGTVEVADPSINPLVNASADAPTKPSTDAPTNPSTDASTNPSTGTSTPRITVEVAAEKAKLKKKVEQLTQLGRRTLVAAVRTLSEAEWAAMDAAIAKAECVIHEREAAIAEAVTVVEQNLVPVGVTGIEDTLRDNVKETISYFLDCGIQCWLVTGDQMRTAVHTSDNCGLLSLAHPENIVLVDGEGRDAVLSKLAALHDRVQKEDPSQLSVVITGYALTLCMDPTLLGATATPNFFKDAIRCKAVICCRITPKQKADIVAHVKKASGRVVMAVGDGGNDVSMLLQSDCGVALRGKEGQQAALAGDFVVNEFHQLRRLLCVHGVNNYSRSWSLTTYSVFKSILLCATQTVYCFFTLFSGTSLFNAWYLFIYSIALFIPILSLITKRIFPDEQLLNNPRIYRYYNGSGDHASSIYSVKALLFYLVLGMLQGACLELVALFSTESPARDFLDHFLFWGIYVLQDIMMCLLIPNITAVYFWDIVIMHVILFIATFALSCVDLTGSMVPYFSLHFALSNTQYYLGGIVIIFTSLLIYLITRVFGNYN